GSGDADPRITLICAGTRGQLSLDDALGAGALIQAVVAISVTEPDRTARPPVPAGGSAAVHAGGAGSEGFRLSDAAQACLRLWQWARDRLLQELASCHHGRLLQQAGFLDDIRFAAQ